MTGRNISGGRLPFRFRLLKFFPGNRGGNCILWHCNLQCPGLYYCFRKNGALIFHCRGEELLRILFAVFIVAAWLVPAGMPSRALLPAAIFLPGSGLRDERLAGQQENPPQYCRAAAERQLPAPARGPVFLITAGALVLPEPPFSAAPSAVFPARSRGPAAQPRPPCGARAGPAGKVPHSFALTV